MVSSLVKDESNRLTYHYAKVMALLSNYDTVIEANVKALNSQGSAYRENEKYLRSMAGQLNTLKATVESKYDNLISSDTLSGLITGLTTVIERMGNFESVLIKVGLLLTAWKSTAILGFFRSFPNAINLAANSLLTMNGSLSLVTRSFNALKVAFMTNPIGWVTIAITGLISIYEMWNKTQEETIGANKASQDAYDAKRQSIESLTEAYKQNFELAKTDEKAKKQLAETESELKKALGLTKGELDSQNKSLDENIAKIKLKSQEQLKAYVNENTPRVQTLQDDQNTKKNRDLGIGTWNLVKNDNTIDELKKQLGFKDTLSLKLDAKEYYKTLQDLLERQGELEKKGISKDYFNDIANESEKVRKEIEATAVATDNLNKNAKELAESGIVGLDKLSASQKKNYDALKNNIKFTSNEQYTKDLENMKKTIESFTTDTPIDEIRTKLLTMFPISAVEPFIKGLQKASDGFYTFGASIGDFEKNLKKTRESMKIFNQALFDIGEGEKLTGEQVDKLIEIQPELADKIQETTDGWVIQKDALELVRQKYIDSQVTMIKAQYDITDATTNAIAERLKQYGIEIDGIQTLSDALGAIGKMQTEMAKKGGYADSEDDNFVIGRMLIDPEYKKLEAVREQMKQYGSYKEKMNALQKSVFDKKYGLSKSDLRGDKKSSTTKPTLQTNDKLEEKDATDELIIALDTLIGKREALQALEENSSLEDKIKLRKEEIGILEQEKKKHSEIADVLRGIRSGKLETNLSNLGATFSGIGDDRVVTNASEISKQLKDKANSISTYKSGDDVAEAAYKKAKLDSDNFDKFYAQYVDTRKKIGAEGLAFQKNAGDISKLKADNGKDTTDDIFKKQESAITPLSQALDKLKSSYEGLTDTQLDEKLSNINDQLANQTSQIDVKNKQIEENGKTWWTLDEDGRKAIHEGTNKLRKEVEDLVKNSNVLGKSKVEVEVDILFNKSTKSAEQYDKVISNLEFKENSLAESDLVGSMAVKAEMIDATTKQIELQTVELDKMNKVEDKAILNDEKFKSSKDALVKSLQSNILKVKELDKAQSSIIIKSVEDTEIKIQDMIKKGLDLRKENLDKELDQYKSFIDEKQKLLDDSYATEDYNADLKKALSERSDIQKQINAISYDQSFAGFQTRKDLEKDYAEATTKINDLQKTRNRSLEKDALAQSLKDKETAIDKTKENLDKEFDEGKVRILAHEALMTQSFDKIKASFPELFSELNTASTGFFDTFTSYTETFGTNIGNMKKYITDELLPTLKIATSYVDKVDGIETNVQTPVNVPPNTQSALNTANTQSTQQYNNSNAIDDAKRQIDEARLEIAKFQKEYMDIQSFVVENIATQKQVDRQIELHRLANEKRDFIKGKKKDFNIPQYANGGIDTQGGLAMLHGSPSRPELILNTNQMANLIRNMSLNNFIPNIKPQTPQLAGGLSGGINLNINIVGNADSSTIGKIKESGNNILNEIKKTLSKNGVYRN